MWSKTWCGLFLLPVLYFYLFPSEFLLTLIVYPGKVTETLYQSMSRNSTGQMQAMIIFFLMNKLPDKTHRWKSVVLNSVVLKFNTLMIF